MSAQSGNSLGCFHALLVVKITYLLSIFIQGDCATVAKEEGSQIPAVGYIKIELFAGFFRRSQDAVQSLYVLFGQHGLIIEQEISVISRHGIAQQHALIGGGVDTSLTVGCNDGVMIAGHFIQSVCLSQADQLVVGIYEHIRSGSRVFQIPCAGVSGAHYAVLEVIAVLRMRGSIGFTQFLEQFLVILAVPNLECDVLGQGSKGSAAKASV